MLFSDVIGQQEAKDFLLQSVHGNRLGHALLLKAPEGAGGLPIALAFSQYMVCTDPKGEEACGKCGACIRAAKLIHPDIHYCYPVIPRKSGDKPLSTDYIQEWREFVLQQPYGNAYDWLQFIGAENKQGNISSAECQDIIRKLNLKSYEGTYKILLMWYPEFLNKEGNRLLKLIEEPPARTLFIFVAEQTEMILPTILSRVQLVRMNRLHTAELKNAAIERGGADEPRALRVASLAEGSYREVLRLMQHMEGDFMEPLRSWLNAIVRADPVALQQWIEEIANAKMGRERQKQFLRYFLHLIEHSLRRSLYANEEIPLPEEEIQFAANLRKMTDHTGLQQLVNVLDDACYHIERNANAKILFHALSLRIRYIFSRQPIPSLA